MIPTLVQLSQRGYVSFNKFFSSPSKYLEVAKAAFLLACFKKSQATTQIYV